MKKTLLIFLLSVTSMYVKSQVQVVADTSLEVTGGGGADWISTSTNFGTVLCDAACGTCGGPCAAYDGSWYAWFGGAGIAEFGTLEQSFSVGTAGPALLRFMYYLPINSATSVDSIMVKLDGANIWVKTALDSTGFNTAYTPVLVPILALSAGTHTLTFAGTESGTGSNTFNALIDDITIWMATGSGFTEYSFDEGFIISHSDNTLAIAYDLKKESDIDVTIMDMSGRLVDKASLKGVQNNRMTFNTTGWASAMYNVVIFDGKSSSIRKVFIEK